MYNWCILTLFLIFGCHGGHHGMADGLLIIGCPLYGCRPSGTFSYSLNVTRKNASIAWISDFDCSPIPRALGCVGNDVNLICQSNGIGIYDTGYVSINTVNGSLKWRDKVLQYPTLPIMDNYGDTIGSDGIDLVKYEYDGTLDPVIYLKPVLKPVFSMQLVGTQFLLMVSEHGFISTRVTNGIPVAEILLRETLFNTNGTFFPVAQPITNGNRIYVLTEFVPDNGQHVQSRVLGMQRLYAIDVHDRMADIMTVAWNFTFEVKNCHPNKREGDYSLRFQPRSWEKTFIQKMSKRDDDTQAPSLLWNRRAKVVTVILTPPLMSASPRTEVASFWGVGDARNRSSLAFCYLKNYTHMAMFEPNGNEELAATKPLADPVLWTVQRNGRISSLKDDGTVSKEFDLTKSLNAFVNVTSKLVTVRSKPHEEDILIFGITVDRLTPKFLKLAQTYGVKDVASVTAYVIAIDTALNDRNDHLPLWMIPSPNNTIVRGQIVGIPGADMDMKDQLAVFAQSDGKFAKFFSIH